MKLHPSTCDDQPVVDHKFQFKCHSSKYNTSETLSFSRLMMGSRSYLWLTNIRFKMWLYSVIVHWCNPIDHPWAAMLDVPFGAIKSSFLFGYKEYIKKSLERSMIQFLRWGAQLNTFGDTNSWVSVCFYHSVWSTISASVPIPRSTPAPWPPVSYSRSSPPWTSSWGETTPEMVPLYTLSLSLLS